MPLLRRKMRNTSSGMSPARYLASISSNLAMSARDSESISRCNMVRPLSEPLVRPHGPSGFENRPIPSGIPPFVAIPDQSDQHFAPPEARPWRRDPGHTLGRLLLPDQ